MLFKINAGQKLYQNALFTTSANKCVQIKIVQPNDIDKLSYEEKNTLLKREQSPHLTIYKPQLTSMLSISHRISGKFEFYYTEGKQMLFKLRVYANSSSFIQFEATKTKIESNCT